MGQQTLFCVACGAPMSDGAQTCAFCGHSLAQASSQPATAAHSTAETLHHLIDPCLPLSPSELLFLCAEQFLPRMKFGYRLIMSGAKVSQEELSSLVATAAVLANEQTGCIRLELGYSERTGHYHRPPPLWIKPTEHRCPWPAGSLEEQILDLVHRSLAPYRASSLILGWIEERSILPRESLLQVVLDGLESRGLMQRKVDTRLKIFHFDHYAPSPQLPSLIENVPTAAHHELLDASKRLHPQILESLAQSVEDGFLDCTLDVAVPAYG